MPRKVVITGIGVVTGLGVGIEALWAGLMAGRSALGPITRFDAAGFPWRLAGEAGELDVRDHVPRSYRKATKVMARDSELAVVAAELAARSAGLLTRAHEDQAPSYRPGRLATHIGAGLMSAEADELGAAFTAAAEHGTLSMAAWGEHGMGNLTPLWMLKYLPNMLACHVSIIHGCEGPSNTITCAEASALLSIGESARVIERGDADCGFAGGAESKVNQMAIARYGLNGRLAETQSREVGAELVRPYDPQSPGQVTGEAGAILILEGADAAEARQAPVWAHISGFGAAHSPAALSLPQPRGSARPAEDLIDEGVQLAIEAALRDAGLAPADIDVIVPHASGHAATDAAEAGALRAVFAERLADIPLITLNPAIGECWAGAGGVQAAAAALALREQTVPARIHAGQPMAGLRAGKAPPEPRRLRHALVCTGGCGGQCAALILSRSAAPASDQ